MWKSRLDIKNGQRETILEGYSLLQVLWKTGEQMLLNVRDSYDDEDYYSKNYYPIKKYSRGSECVPLVESETEVHILGVQDGWLHYLESNKTGSHRI
jgi:hypothetical protein